MAKILSLSLSLSLPPSLSLSRPSPSPSSWLLWIVSKPKHSRPGRLRTYSVAATANRPASFAGETRIGCALFAGDGAEVAAYSRLALVAVREAFLFFFFVGSALSAFILYFLFA